MLLTLAREASIDPKSQWVESNTEIFKKNNNKKQCNLVKYEYKIFKFNF